MSTATLDKAAFASWLASLPPDAPCGTKYDCPLAHFLRESGVFGVCVGLNAWYSGEDLICTHPLPSWAFRFILWADRAPYPDGQRWQHITAAEALAALTQSAPPRGEGEQQP